MYIHVFMIMFNMNVLLMNKFKWCDIVLQERHRAESLGYDDPINPTFEATTEMYERVLCEVLRQIKDTREKGKIAVMVASHNEDTVRYTVKK